MENIIYLKYVAVTIVSFIVVGAMMMCLLSLMFPDTFSAIDKKIAKWLKGE